MPTCLADRARSTPVWAGNCTTPSRCSASAIDRCAQLLDTRLHPGLIELLYGEASDLLDDTRYTQPAIFAIEYALAELWLSWGVEPIAVLGHSVGEYAAACVAGFYSLEQSLDLIAGRAQLMGDLPKGEGAMAAILAPEEQVRALLDSAAEPGVSIAALNGPENVVISGHSAAVQRLAARFSSSGVRVEPLRVSHAFHSPLMEPVESLFAARAAAVDPRSPRLTLVSSVTGQPVKRADLQSQIYWRRQVRDSVRFHDAMRTLAELRCQAFLEIGPGSTLLGMGQACIGAEGQLWAPSLRRAKPELQQLAESVGRLYVNGAEIDWKGYHAQHDRCRTPLPTYPFERQRHWVDDLGVPQPATLASRTGHPLLGHRIDVAGNANASIWHSSISLRTHPWIADHRVQTRPVLPATAYVELAGAAFAELYGETPVSIAGMRFEKPLFLQPDSVYELQCRFEQTAASSGRFEVYSRQSEKSAWTLHAGAKVFRAPEGVPAPPALPLPDHRAIAIDGPVFYRRMAELGNDWGTAFQGLESARVAAGEGWSRVSIAEPIRGEIGAYRFHPALSDACGHIMPGVRIFATSDEPRALVGKSLGEVTLYARPRGASLTCHARIRRGSDPSELIGDVAAYDEDGKLLSTVTGAVLRYLEEDSQRVAAAGPEDWFHALAWEPFEPALTVPAGMERTWLVVGNNPEIAGRVCAALRSAGSHPIVAPAAGTADALLAGLPHDRPLGVVYLGAMLAHAPESAESPFEATGCAGVLRWVRTLSPYRDARLYLVTRALYTQSQSSNADPIWQAPVWGLGRTLAVEQPGIWGGLIDLDPQDDAAATLLGQLLLSGPAEDQVKIEGGRFFAARLERIPAPQLTPLQLAPDGAYLVTGGLNGLGLEVARWLVRQGARHLILMSRTVLPARSEWRNIPGDLPVSAIVRAILDLESRGAAVYHASVDVANPRALQSFLDGYAAECRPRVRGVVHAAGVLNHGAAVDMLPEEFDALLAPKLAAWTLAWSLRTQPLDFFCLFSSASALLGSPKLGGYAAANCFLDALARHRAASGLPATSVNWGLWKETGMAARFDTGDVQARADRGMGGMTTEQGLDALGRGLGSARSNLAVLPVHWATWARLYPTYAKSAFFSRLTGEVVEPARGSAESVVDVIGRLQGVERRAAIQDRLIRTLSAITGFSTSDMELDRPVTDLGIDSLMAIEFRNRIQKDFGVVVTIVQLLDGAPLRRLLDHVAEGFAPLAPVDSSAPDVDSMSDTEVDAMLVQLLARGE